MSGLAENYDKAAIGAGLVAALGVGALVFLGQDKISEDFQSGGGQNGQEAGTPNDWKLNFLEKSLESPTEYTRKSFGDREVDLFVGTPLYVKKDNLDDSIDILKGETVHPPVPNLWFIENRLEIGFDDALERDPDSDGFTNLEEYEAKTDPTDSNSFPELLDKLVVTKIEETPFLIEWKGAAAGKARLDLKTEKELFRSDFEEPGNVFPKEGPYKNGFKFTELKILEEENPNTGVVGKTQVAIVVDQREGVAGREYIARSSRNRALGLPKGYLGTDRAAVLVLNAVGEQDKPFTIPEGQSFSVPSGQDEKPYTVTSITPEGKVTITLPSGETIERQAQN